MTPPPNASTYDNWGTYDGIFDSQPGLALKEPNNYDYAPEYCATADFFEAPTLAAGNPWGWNDQNCILRYAYICKYWPRGWRARSPHLPGHVRHVLTRAF